jgi:hypothetical protein
MNTTRSCFALSALVITALLTASACGDEGVDSTGTEGEQSGDVSGSEADGEGSDPEMDSNAEAETAGPAVGTTWAVDMAQATWVTPEDVDDLVALMTVDYPVLLGISGSADGTVDVMLGTGDATGQLMCNRTVEATGLTVDADGGLTFTSESFSLANGLTMINMTLTAAIDAETGAITSLDAQGDVVMSSIPTDLLPLDDGQTACDLTEGLGMPCMTCASEPATGGPVDCIEVHVTNLQGSVLTNVALVPITEADCHAECADNGEECDTSGW